MNFLNAFIPRLDWCIFLVCLLALVMYELRQQYLRRHYPYKIARLTHAAIRANWVRQTMIHRGTEVTAVQTLRNSMMSATITASTAILCLMGTLSFTAPYLSRVLIESQSLDNILSHPLSALLLALLTITLFAAFVFSTMAVRFYNHLGYMMATPLDAPHRETLIELGAAYAIRAGDQYSLSLRCFFYIAPLVAGLVYVPFMLPATLGLMAALNWFNSAPTIASQNSQNT